MTTLAILYPSTALAAVDPLALRRARERSGEGQPSLDEARRWAASRIEMLLDALPTGEGDVDRRWYWMAPLLLDGDDALQWLNRSDVATLWTQDGGGAGWREHVQYAAAAVRGEDAPLGRRPDDLVEVLSDLALAGPGVCALRAIARVLGGSAALGRDDVRDAAGQAAWGLRSLFNTPEAIALVSGRRGYWRRVLATCAEGNLQAVLDELVHLVFDLEAIWRRPPDKQAGELGARIARVASLRSIQLVPDAISVHRGRISVTPQTMRTRFAVRYGDHPDRQDKDVTSAEVVRDAFNSPFAPFVLATTSIGQEGLDFHAYCHAVVHWNLPSNPVDLEQREGRVHRYKGHALRKNIAARVGGVSFLRDAHDPWNALFDEAESCDLARSDTELVPYWVFPGPARIERHVPIQPLSRDVERLARLQRSRALYRAVLGQPRQEDLLELIAERGLPGGLRPEDLRVDLSPTAEVTGG